MGNTADETSNAWSDLSKLLNETWKTEDSNELQLRILAVDSGYNTLEVYNWVRKQSADRVRAIKGSDSSQHIFNQPKDVDVNRDGSRVRRATKVWSVGVSVIKSELYGWLQLNGAGDDGKYLPGYCHYPQYDELFFQGLCSEQLIQKVVNGRTVYKWIKVFERNEPLDCRIYARAAASMFGIDRFTDQDWKVLTGKYAHPKEQKNTPIVSEPIQKPKQQPKQNDYWARQNHKNKFRI